MLKRLKRALGAEVADGEPGTGVVGRVGTSPAGNSILEIGTLNEDKSWTKLRDGGHIVLNPDEREVLIGSLESHRPYRVLELGDVVTVKGEEYEVLAVHYLNATADGEHLRGAILTYSANKQQWAVFTANPQGEANYGTYTPHSQDALNAYATRIVEHTYTHFNATPPALTFAHVADRDKLRSGT
jgi:hypothetical protein